MKRFLFLFFILSAAAPSTLNAQVFHRKTNQWKDGQREGYWEEYFDSARSIPMYRGYYTRGMEMKKWKYYYEDGTVRKKERYRNGRIRTRYYYPNGKLKSRGDAVLDRSDPQHLHYYYHGRWIYCNEKGRAEYRILYEKGVEVGKEKIN